jgi:FtsZ-binding cell division protein ZapB
MTPQSDETIDRWSPSMRIEALTRQVMRLNQQLHNNREEIANLKHVNHLLKSDYEDAQNKIKTLQKKLRKLEPPPLKPQKPPQPYYSTERYARLYVRAHREHAWLLRSEGLTFVEIGKYMGTSKGVARQRVVTFNRIMGWATRKTKWHHERSVVRNQGQPQRTHRHRG